MTRSSENCVLELLSTALGANVEKLLNDPTITEVRANPDGKVWASRLGQGKFFTEVTLSPDSIRKAIYTVAYSVNEVCNEARPMLSAELPGTGERFQGVLPPLVSAPIFTIRKRAVKIFSLNDLVEQGVLDSKAKNYLTKAMLERKNILVVGGTDSGKTTFANALLDVLNESTQRIVIIEDTQELQCRGGDVTFMRTKEGVATLRDLVKVSLRLSPDRIVIGEVRGPEALDLLKAWNTGHSGGVSTVHANSASLGLSRLEQLVQESGVQVSRSLISEAVSVLIYMEKIGAKRALVNILEVKDYKRGDYVMDGVWGRAHIVKQPF